MKNFPNRKKSAAHIDVRVQAFRFNPNYAKSGPQSEKCQSGTPFCWFSHQDRSKRGLFPYFDRIGHFLKDSAIHRNWGGAIRLGPGAMTAQNMRFRSKKSLSLAFFQSHIFRHPFFNWLGFLTKTVFFNQKLPISVNLGHFSTLPGPLPDPLLQSDQVGLDIFNRGGGSN